MSPQPATARTLYGDNALPGLAAEIRNRGWRRLMLVCGKASFEASGAAAILPELAGWAAVTRWNDFAPNPDSRDVARGLHLLHDTAPDAVLGIGGGSAMDIAKLLAGFALQPEGADVDALVRHGRAAATRSIGLCLVPTTSGSGAEATHFAVAYIGQEKFSVGGPSLYSDVVALDPRLAMSGSAHQRASSGIDAVCQAIESLWAAAADDSSRRTARHALGLLLPAVERFVAAPDERSARAMAIGSHLAGRAIDTSRTTAAHALSYAITKGYGVSHGAAVALTLPALLELHAEATAEQLRPGLSPERHRAAVTSALRALGATTGAEAATRFRALLGRIGLPTGLAAVGLTTAAERRHVVRTVNLHRLDNNPVALSEDDLTAILERSA